MNPTRVGGTRIQVEYVSANPTGPMNVVSARAAAVGAALVRLLRATGHDAEGEFYVNDAGTQTDLLGESLASRFAALHGIDRPLPPEGYQGSYLEELARELPEAEALAALKADDGRAWFRDQALERMVEWAEEGSRGLRRGVLELVPRVRPARFGRRGCDARCPDRTRT